MTNAEGIEFYIVDVFAEKKYAGNQLAVVCDYGRLTDQQMQQIANEMHFSETTFILSKEERNNGYDVRIFTPKAEVPFAGHPTLGTAYVIQKFLSKKKTAAISLNLKVGQIPVNFDQVTENETAWMKQNQPVFGEKFEQNLFAKLLGIDVSDIYENYPIQEVSTGIPFIIVPLRTLKAVKKARIDQKVQEQLFKTTQDGILIFCPETYSKENDLNVRVFVDAYGIPEDPATGSGNGCLAAYLSQNKYFGKDKIDARVEQGCEIGRPSLLHLKAEKQKGKIQVWVGGKVINIANGQLF